MPRGRVPRDVLSRQRDTDRRQAETVTVEDTGALAGPELPQGVLPDGEAWHPQTVALWADLRRSPLMRDEPALTWSYLLDTAALHHRLWAHGEYRHAPELRLRLAKIAATPEDRQRMKIKIAERVPADGRPSSLVTDIAARRARLTE